MYGTLKTALKKNQLKALMSKDGVFGVMSAYAGGLSKTDNQRRHGELMRDLQMLGVRPTSLKGSWQGVTEKSFLIPNIRPEDLFDLGRKYAQDAVIYKSKDGVLGMYYTKGTPRAEVAVDPKGDPAFQVSERDDLFSKSRGLSFEFGFLWGEGIPWDGNHPISRKKLREFSSLREPSALRVANNYLRLLAGRTSTAPTDLGVT